MDYHEIGEPFKYNAVDIVAQLRQRVDCQGCLFCAYGGKCLLRDGNKFLELPPSDAITMCDSSVRKDRKNIIYVCNLNVNIKSDWL